MTVIAGAESGKIGPCTVIVDYKPRGEMMFSILSCSSLYKLTSQYELPLKNRIANVIFGAVVFAISPLAISRKHVVTHSTYKIH